MSKFYTGVRDQDIKMSHIYRTAFPFTIPQPLKVFESCINCNRKSICDGVTDNCGKVEENKYGINRQAVLDPNNEEGTLSVIIPHKVRPAVVIQSDIYNQRENYPYAFVAPILTLKREGKSPSFLRKLTEENNNPQLHYIGTHTGREAYVNIADIKRLHKSFLLEIHEAAPLEVEVMNIIFMKLGDLLGIEKGKISACKTCQLNCDNCELKKLANTTAANE